MLTKAILTGGVLALLSGSIVYFGTDGADALDNGITKDTLVVKDTELAGGPVSKTVTVKTAEAEAEPEAAVKTPEDSKPEDSKREKKKARALAQTLAAQANDAEVENGAALEEPEAEDTKMALADPIAPPAEQADAKPKTKWLDQYLKKTQPKKDDETMSEDIGSEDMDEDNMSAQEMSSKKMIAEEEKSSATTFEAGPDADEAMKMEKPRDARNKYKADRPSSAKKYREKSDSADMDEKKSDHGETASSATHYAAKPDAAQMDETDSKAMKGKIIIEMDGDDSVSWTSEDGAFDLEKIEEIMREHKGAEKEIRVLRMEMNSDKKEKTERKAKSKLDYDMVLEEARKLQVIDMRNIAFFEIIDYAIDRRNFDQAADILEELSDPELRDTARAKIGVGLAKNGDSEAAFAVLNEMEIPELTSSIRLEIITALVATKAERTAPNMRR